MRKKKTLLSRGRNVGDGLPKDFTISSAGVREALADPLATIVEAIRTTLEKTPPELSADIIDHGIMLTGGGALLKGLDMLVMQQTGMPVHIAERPLDCVVDGAGKRQLLTNVTLPMMMPSITICTFLTLTNSFKLFDQNLSLTGGEPNHASEMLALNIYNTFYTRSGPQWKGIGQAKAVIFFVLVVAIALVQLRATRSREVQQ